MTDPRSPFLWQTGQPSCMNTPEERRRAAQAANSKKATPKDYVPPCIRAPRKPGPKVKYEPCYFTEQGEKDARALKSGA